MNTLYLSILLATICAFTRASLSIFDRLIFSKNTGNVVRINNINNIIPLASIVLVSVYFGRIDYAVIEFTSMRIALIGISLQILSLSFSFAFRSYSVRDVAVAVKMSDVSICIILLLTGAITAREIGSGLITFFVVPILIIRRPIHLGAILIIVISVLTFQSSIMHAQNDPNKSQLIIIDELVGIMIWRYISSMITATINKRINKLRTNSTSNQYNKNEIDDSTKIAIIIRGILMATNQITFVASLSFGHSIEVWSILNISNYLSILMASLILHEKIDLIDALAFLVITAAGVTLSLVLT